MYNVLLGLCIKSDLSGLQSQLRRTIYHCLAPRVKKCQSKKKAQVALLKEDCSLFSWLYIACRDGNLDEFKYEDQLVLSQIYQVRGGQKAYLVKCLEMINVSDDKQPPVDAIILDGAVAVQMMAPGAACTFSEYFDMVFQPFILKQFESARFFKECNEGKEKICYMMKGISVHSYSFKLAKFPACGLLQDRTLLVTC